VGRILPAPASLETFAEPLKNTLDVNLTDNPIKRVEDSFTQDEIDDAVADESEFNMY